jgi:molybdopterin molybdotransferase
LEEAQRTVLGAMSRLATGPHPLDEALGMVLSDPVIAPHDVPPFTSSAMDGYALRAEDATQVPVALQVIDTAATGDPVATRLESGCAIKIMTGAPLPWGADAVIPIESTSPGENGTVTVEAAVDPGDCIREVGEDLRSGTVVLEPGLRLSPADVGLLAMIGVAEPKLVRCPRVAILSTGDEVLPVDTRRLPTGFVRDVNRALLRAMLEDLRVDVVDCGIIPDSPTRLMEVLEEAASKADVIVASGGVSMGDFDVVKQTLMRLGTFDVWKVALQPGKPFAFGLHGNTPVFGLPGNPVAVVVTFEQLVRPALLRLMGAGRLFRPQIVGTMGERVVTNDDKTVFLRVGLAGPVASPTAYLSGGQSSGILSSMSAAAAFAVVPAGASVVRKGAPITLEMFRRPEERTFEDVLGVDAAEPDGIHRPNGVGP